MNEQPRITVIVPCFNQARYLGAALESLQAQTWPHWDCIVVDDGSTDNSAAVAAWYGEEDARITCISQPNAGLAAARNAGLDRATGEYIQFLDADDLLHPEKFSRQLDALAAVPGAVVAFCKPFAFAGDDPQTELVPRPQPPSPAPDRMLLDLARGVNVPCHAYLFDASLFRDTGLRFNEALPNHEDWECWMRLFADDPVTVFVDEKLALYRRHGGAMSNDLEAMRLGFIQAIRLQLVGHEAHGEVRERLRKRARALEAGRYADAYPGPDAGPIPMRRRIGNVLRLFLPEKRVLQIRHFFYGDF